MAAQHDLDAVEIGVAVVWMVVLGFAFHVVHQNFV